MSSCVSHSLTLCPAGQCSQSTCVSGGQCVQSWWVFLYDIIQEHRGMKGSKDQIYTGSCYFVAHGYTHTHTHTHSWGHTQTPQSHRWPAPHLQTVTLMFDLTCVHFLIFFMFVAEMMGDPHTHTHTMCNHSEIITLPT